MTLEADITLRQGNFTLDARFTAPDGITALFGPSGAGKSTLLAALSGLKAVSGRIALNGASCAHIKPHRRGFGLVFQDARLFPHLTVRGNLAYAWRRARRHALARFDIAEVAGFFDIANLLDRPVGNLSGGEKSRVALARALVAAPEFAFPAGHLVILQPGPRPADGIARLVHVLARLGNEHDQRGSQGFERFG